MRMMRMHYPSPQWFAKLMDYIHLAQQMADARNFTKASDGISPKEENLGVPAQDRRNAWTLANASPLTRSASILGSVPGRRIMAARAAACKDASLWVLEATAVMQQSADKVRLLMVQIHLFRGHVAEVWDTTKAVKDRCQRS
jgi:hypothetical protein